MVMIFEFMSRGNIARLPDGMTVDGLPEGPFPRVLLLLPYNRYLVGSATMKHYERWTLGKLGTDESTEVFLYEGKPKTLLLGEVEKVTISVEVISQLKSCLSGQMPPPGEHMPSALILRGLIGEEHLLGHGEFLQNEEAFFDVLEKDPTAKMAYWSIRLALFRNDYEAVSRVKTWMKSAADVFEGVTQPPRIWFSLTDLPGKRDIEEMEGLAFSLDDLQRMNSQSSRPVVLYSKSGYLILSDFGGEGPDSAFRIWMFLPIALWNEMRERRKLSIREIVMASWGYLDGLSAEKERSRYAQRTTAQGTRIV